MGTGEFVIGHLSFKEGIVLPQMKNDKRQMTNDKFPYPRPM
jgi:hypothetical protein